jgi:hypothetical protein
MAPLSGQDRLESWPFIDLLIHNPGIMVNFTNGIEAPVSRKSSAERLASSWNHLVDEFRANESRFSSTENHELTAMLLHIQGGLSFIGLRSAGKDAIRNSWQDLEQLVSNTSALCTLLECKHSENPGVPGLRKLSMTARVLDEDARRLAPTVPASQLHPRLPEKIRAQGRLRVAICRNTSEYLSARRRSR